VALECPNCGAVHEPSNPGIVVIVCDRCDSTLYLEDAVLRQGRESVVGEPRGNIAVGASGRVGKAGVEVIGRVRLSHSRGGWDEWYVRTADGQERWLIEDEKSYALEAALAAVPEGAHPAMELGDGVVVGGARFEVRELGEATCDGGEGQLPRVIQPGETYRFFDLIEIGGSRLLSIEFDPDGTGQAFVGKPIEAEQVRFKASERPTGMAVQRASTITCASCGAPFTLPEQGQAALTAGCPNCGAVLELDGAQSLVVGRTNHLEQQPFHLEIGARGELLEHTWEVVGRLQLRDDEGYWTHEYLLWSGEAGYLWLEYDGGHFSWSRKLEVGLPLGTLESARRGTRVTVGGTVFQLISRGDSKIVYVDGALPWAARIGDRQKNWNLAAPPELLSVEASENELEVFRGEWLCRGTIESAFGLGGLTERPWLIHFAQPNPWAPWRAAAFAALVIAAFNFVVVGIATVWPTHEVVSFTIPPTATGVQEVESNPFVLDPALGALMGVHYRTEVDNSWVYVDLELTDPVEDEALAWVGQELEYYYGYDDGNWSEGSRTKTQWMQVPEKGTYALSGTLEYDRSTPVKVVVVQGGMLSRYNAVLLVLFGAIGVVLLSSFFKFERARMEDA